MAGLEVAVIWLRFARHTDARCAGRRHEEQQAHGRTDARWGVGGLAMERDLCKVALTLLHIIVVGSGVVPPPQNNCNYCFDSDN